MLSAHQLFLVHCFFDKLLPVGLSGLDVSSWESHQDVVISVKITNVKKHIEIIIPCSVFIL